MTEDTKLTALETVLLEKIKEGMDEPGTGWLHEITEVDANGNAPASTVGVLGSLVKKGLATSYVEEACDGIEASWVEITQEGARLAGLAGA